LTLNIYKQLIYNSYIVKSGIILIVHLTIVASTCLSAINAENQQIAKQPPSFTPNM